jgi:hypothetical protein
MARRWQKDHSSLVPNVLDAMHQDWSNQKRNRYNKIFTF